jgi:RNA polymerase sigma-70 factor, ECF subfamily
VKLTETHDPDGSSSADSLQTYVQLLTEHQCNLRAFIVSLMPGSPDVKDVLQETNAVLWQKRHRFKPGTNFLAWALTIARIEVRRQHDRNRRLGRLVFSNDVLDVLYEANKEPDHDYGVLLNALETCMGKLSDPQRDIIRERYTPGCSLEQMAERTGRSAGSLRIALLRIRDSLKNCVNRTLANSSA